VLWPGKTGGGGGGVCSESNWVKGSGLKEREKDSCLKVSWGKVAA
jgi:hypothetical protein